MMYFQKAFSQIQQAWADNLDEILEAAREGKASDPYFFDWAFSPIEEPTWCEIRGRGVPMYPEFPVNGFFLDFADPYRKIAIECDGEKFHIRAKDAKRDEILMADGWEIYRVPGRYCLTKLDYELIHEFVTGHNDDQEAADEFYRFVFESVDGLVASIALIKYGRTTPALSKKLAQECLDYFRVKREAA